MDRKVTVLTCVYNGLPYLKDAIESTLNQTYKNFEYLIIDDCSPDKDVIKVIESYDDTRIRFIKNEENLGVAGTINKALSLINTRYVIRLDQDDVSLPNRLERQLDFMERHPNIDVSCTWEHTIDSCGNKQRDWKRNIDNYGDFLGYVLTGICPIWHPSLAFKKDALMNAGGFKEEYTRAEDFEVTTRLALKRFNAAVVPEFLLLQRQHESSQSKEFATLQYQVTQKIHIEALQYFSKHQDIELLAGYLRLEKSSVDSPLNRYMFSKICEALEDLYLGVSLKQHLSTSEMSSLKKRINKRIGYAANYHRTIVKYPSFLFKILYYALSPFQIKSFRSFVSSAYHKALFARYRLLKNVGSKG